MEERIPQPRKTQGSPTVAATAVPVPCDGNGDGGEAPVLLLSSGEEESSDEGELEFEFPFVSRDSPAGTAAAADELFADGRIRTFYPVFGRGGGCVRGGSTFVVAGCAAAAPAPEPQVRGQLGRLFLEETRERNSSTSSTASSAATDDDAGLDGAAPESYCVWRPGASASSSQRPTKPLPRKSGSTGSMARWRRISDLVVGRSHSDGKEKFLFFAAAPHDAPKRHRPSATATTTPMSASRKPPPAVAPATDAADAAHRIAYLVPPGATPRRTFLPYREELLGFFANVNGVSRSHHHPF